MGVHPLKGEAIARVEKCDCLKNLMNHPNSPQIDLAIVPRLFSERK
ncbi:MAG: hypothetical protein KME16_23470 [Scytolyngbya sp. HA4215-MV1]|nr:hypothetical protein [Scytolyngbya sp. HA4215-MV1]